MPRTVVSNTTPLITLAGLGKLGLLKDLYGEVLVPEAVVREVEAGRGQGFYADLGRLPWFKTGRIQDRSVMAYLLKDLDEGEAEVIALAGETKADLLIIDERVGRGYAQMMGFDCTGSLGILMKAKEKGLIPEVKPLLMQMRENGIWLSDTLEQQVLKLCQES